VAFLSTTKSGISKINCCLTPGAAVSIPRDYVDYIITEYGIAPMRGRSVYARVNNLIAIAHPDHRAELRRQAEKLSYI
jgi:acyl-CoA hydrolase